MKIKKILSFVIISNFLFSCADYKIAKTPKDEKKYFTSHGFALIYEENLFKQKVINKKINNEKIYVIHDFLKVNTPLHIINPTNQKKIETKVHKRGDYPKIFNIVISKKIADTLDLDYENPYVEVLEIKKNKKFIAKESNTFDEEKNVAEKAPVEEIKMDIITEWENITKKSEKNEGLFIIIISDFYYEDSAQKLKNELSKKTNINNFHIKKINNKKYRLFAGPFKTFNTLKTSYISLNNLGFENLDIYRD